MANCLYGAGIGCCIMALFFIATGSDIQAGIFCIVIASLMFFISIKISEIDKE